MDCFLLREDLGDSLEQQQVVVHMQCSAARIA